jgi:hypothetical protein
MMSLPACNDLVLFATLAYSAVDIQSEWASFSRCHKPVHQWLLASYALLLAYRLMHYLGNIFSSTVDVEFLVNLRQKGRVPQTMLYLTWLVVMPAFCLWTVAGSFWTWQVVCNSPNCLPSQFLWFTVLWQVVSYFWILAHCVLGFAALSREWKLRLVEADLRALEDPETLERWGAVSQLQSSPMSLSMLNARGRHGRTSRPGLSPAEIQSLGGIRQKSDWESCADDECPICLAELCDTDTLRQLPTCVHCFHRSCIDLWLLQSASCPLCKVEVIPRSKDKPSFCV